MSSDLPPGDPRHGMNGYRNLGCRCDVCRAANTAYVRGARARRRALLTGLTDAPVVQHGNADTYANWGCRCQPCRGAHSVARARQLAAQKARASQVTP